MDLDDGGDLYSLNGTDYVLDLIAETEIPPAFPVCKSYFLVAANREKKRSPDLVPSSPHNPEQINTFELEVEESPPAPTRYGRQPFKSRSIDDITRIDQHSPQEYVSRQKRKEKLRSSSHERFLDDIDKMEPPLSKTSVLNDRYFDGGAKTRSDMTVEDPYHSKTRPEPLGGASATVLGLSKTSRLNERYAEPQREVPGLSETSKLNKRYLVGNQKTPPDTNQHSRTISSSPPGWQDELGLASSALNDRYFSRQEILKNTKTDASDTGSRFEGDTTVASITGISNKVNGHSPDLNGDSHPVRDANNSSQASNDGIDFPEFDFPDANGDDDQQEHEDDLDASSRATESTRYVKYAGGRPPPPGRPHAARALVDRHRDDYGSLGPRSSALSDTSEAPSLASHVKNVRIPSHTSDLDQYLDDLFNPVLDGNLDELSDARSLAASIKGGGSVVDSESLSMLDDLLPESKDFENLKDPESLVKSLKGGGKAVGGGVEAQHHRHGQSISSEMSSPAPPATPGSANMANSPGNLPLYNLSGMTVPMVDASQLIQQQLLQQQMIQVQNI